MNALERLFQIVPQGTLGSKYRLDRCLGDGTYGYVWKAERLSDHEIVALKIPKAQGSKNRDLEEGDRLIDAEHHENVISVYWMGRVPPQNEIFVIEMEYFNSHTLAFLLDARDDRLIVSYRHILGLYEQVLAGVSHLHKLQIAHGDIKPQNILVQGDRVKLTDFGSSLTQEDFYLRSRENGGTILYSPPESAGLSSYEKDWSQAVSHDVYSLGVLLYHFLTGNLPHDTPAQVSLHSPFPRPREISSTIAPDLESFVLRCLEREPQDRWPSIAEMAAAFHRAKNAQLAYREERDPVGIGAPQEDWSSAVIKLMEARSWREAESAARVEYRRTGDAHAFLWMIRAAMHDERYFDVLQALETSPPEILDEESPVAGDLERLALEAYLRTEKIDDASRMVDRCLRRQGDRPGLLLRKASLLGLQAKYREAADILIRLNRELPRRRAILKRLVMVHEQLRDPERAEAFRQVLERVEEQLPP